MQVVYITAMIIDFFITLSAVQIYDFSYIHLQVWIVLSDINLLGQENEAELRELISKIELIPNSIPLKLFLCLFRLVKSWIDLKVATPVIRNSVKCAAKAG